MADYQPSRGPKPAPRKSINSKKSRETSQGNANVSFNDSDRGTFEQESQPIPPPPPRPPPYLKGGRKSLPEATRQKMLTFQREKAATYDSSPIDGQDKDPLYACPAKQAVSFLEKGVIIWLVTNKKKPESLTVCLKSERGELILVRSLNSKPHISVSLEDIKEIASNSRRRLSRLPDEIQYPDGNSAVITLFYGNNFRLQTLSFMPQASGNEGDHQFGLLTLGLLTAVANFKDANIYTRKNRWFHQEFHKLEQMNFAVSENMICLKHIKAWLLQHGYKSHFNYLVMLHKKLKLPKQFGVDGFIYLAEEILKSKLTDQIMREYGTPRPDGTRYNVSVDSFKRFLAKEQEDDVNNCHDRMLSCLPPDVTEMDVIFTQQQFEDYLLSPHNSIFSNVEISVNQDMDQPLSNYWIASSHNTYLTGDQYKGESSVEAYAKCLLMGCRCIELDCFDGDDGCPIITHGKTLTSKIKALDVLHTIKEQAWVVTDFPLILSIENHCNVTQQRQLAGMFKEIFQGDLLTETVAVNESELPSPNQLRRKIIIKNKKLSEGKTDEQRRSQDLNKHQWDISDMLKDGKLYMKYTTSENWAKCDFYLTQTCLCFVNRESDEEEVEEEDEEEEEEYKSIEDYFQEEDNGSDEELEEDVELRSKFWFHGPMSRKAAEKAILEKQSHGDGTFLVRESDKGGGYVISILCQGIVAHSKIVTVIDSNGNNQYLVGNECLHQSVIKLVDYYKDHKLNYREKAISINFVYGVCRNFDFFSEGWFYRDVDRVTAENMLRNIPIDGVFLVRHSSVDNCFTLSLRYRNRLSHLQIEFILGKFTLGKFSFSSMAKLIKFFKQHALLHKMKLSLGLTEQLMEQEFEGNTEVYCSVDYTDINLDQKTSVTALYDFTAYTPEQLSFKRGAVITNVTVTDQPWWYGDHGDSQQKLFPSAYVKVNRDQGSSAQEQLPPFTVLPLIECSIQRCIKKHDMIYCFELTHQAITLQIGSLCALEITEWLNVITSSLTKPGNEGGQKKKEEKTNKKIAKELSDLIIYCQAVPFNPNKQAKYSEISSFNEDRIEKDVPGMTRHNKSRLSRVYPKASRIKSSNYDPAPKWNIGCQMVALNYQTPDRAMQLNQGLFRQNGRCGYVLKPELMQSPEYLPSNPNLLRNELEPIVLTISVLAGRNLPSADGIVHPFVVVEIIGLSSDNQMTRTGNLTGDSNLNLSSKNETFTFHITCPQLAFLRFEVYGNNNDSNLLGQATFPLRCICQGYRNVQLQNCHSQDIPMSYLLVHVHTKYPKEEQEKNLLRMIEETRRLYDELSVSANYDDESKCAKLQETEQKLLSLVQQSKAKGSRRAWRRH